MGRYVGELGLYPTMLGEFGLYPAGELGLYGDITGEEGLYLLMLLPYSPDERTGL
jgi:hypothetical protein